MKCKQMEFERLDVIVARRLNISRAEAQMIIQKGNVEIAGRAAAKLKPGTKITDAEAGIISITGGGRRFASQGGEKLEAALRSFNINVQGRVCMDVGASTGGFTDCLLQHGASKVYAVENGNGQLATSLAADPRVVNLENTDIRSISEKMLNEGFGQAANFEYIDLVTVDVSFISLTLVLDSIVGILPHGAELVCLIKPQFEVGKGNVGKSGIVRSPKLHRQAVEKVNSFAEGIGLTRKGILPTQVGKEKNQEFLVYYTLTANGHIVPHLPPGMHGEQVAKLPTSQPTQPHGTVR